VLKRPLWIVCCTHLCYWCLAYERLQSGRTIIPSGDTRYVGTVGYTSQNTTWRETCMIINKTVRLCSSCEWCNNYWTIQPTMVQVHNIVLYPDKHSWCTSTPIKQVISDVDCDPVEIDNLVCLGACFSYSIPRTVPANNGDEVNSYCDSCQPVNTLWIPVSMMANIITYLQALGH